jgi:hypothetical protein
LRVFLVALAGASVDKFLGSGFRGVADFEKAQAPAYLKALRSGQCTRVEVIKQDCIGVNLLRKKDVLSSPRPSAYFR